MRNLSLILLAAITASALPFPASAQAPPKKKGQTIFGENRKATMKAMRNISKAIGEKCTYCHVKEGGKVVYKKDTPNKEVARQMKLAVVDSLVAKNFVEFSFPHHGKTMVVRAEYAGQGDGADILLSSQHGDHPRREGSVAPPPDGEALSCKTCHNGKVHILMPKK